MTQTEKTKLPRGIRIRKHKTCETIQISFIFRNVECKETISLPPTKENIRRAVNKRNIILAEIDARTFDYFAHFPKSPKAKLFSETKKRITLGELLTKQIEDYQKMYEKGNLSISTLVGYKKINNMLLKFFNNIYINDLTSHDIRLWLEQQSNNDITTKTIRNRLSLLNAVLTDAVSHKLIKTNPLEEIQLSKEINKTASKSDYEIEPFTEEEKQIIIDNAEGQIKNLIQFNFWTGLRISELIALKWSDIDLEKSITHVKRAKVENEIKTTKTKAGIRKVIILPKAKEALINQLEFTKDSEFIFHNPNTNKAWSSSNKIGEAWKRVLDKTNVKYRNPYQMRHTYASTLLSNGENIFWLATQMGHENTEMLFKHYGRWIPENENNGYNFNGKY
ncbi:MAG: DUF3596 domain-containing protein [Proteobacteria bacterium]|nr:MAG: DUF3596 domain-containing protein [Pseudomonadota bacterium]